VEKILGEISGKDFSPFYVFMRSLAWFVTALKCRFSEAIFKTTARRPSPSQLEPGDLRPSAWLGILGNKKCVKAGNRKCLHFPKKNRKNPPQKKQKILDFIGDGHSIFSQRSFRFQTTEVP